MQLPVGEQEKGPIGHSGSKDAQRILITPHLHVSLSIDCYMSESWVFRTPILELRIVVGTIY